LWPSGVPNSQPSDEKETSEVGSDGLLRVNFVQEPTLTIYPAPAENNTGRAVIICPGGGYWMQAWTHEGIEIAEWLNSIGVTAAILKYRLPHSKSVVVRHEAPMQDAQRAIRLLRSRASDWAILKDKIGIMGFSAGGHLASTATTHFDPGDVTAMDPVERQSCRPDFAMLIYPVITMKDPFTHKGSRANLLGENPDPELVQYFSNELHVTAQTPPTFIVHSTDDAAVPVENSLDFYRALRQNGILAEMHIYQHGGHGYGIRPEMGGPAASWAGRANDWFDTFSYVRVANIFGDNMVLQRGIEVPVWGWGEPGDDIEVVMTGKTYSAKIDPNGRWQVRLDPMQAGGPHRMSIRGRNHRVELRDILIGDVWFCGGQSNMAWPVDRVNDSEQEIASANWPEIRHITVSRTMATSPEKDVARASWQRAVGENIRNLTAVGYFFARELYREKKVPIGLINDNWGGTVAETWTSPEALAKLPDFKPVVEEMAKDKRSTEQIRHDLENDRIAWEASIANKDPGLNNGMALWGQPTFDDSGWKSMMVPGLWEDAGHPDLDGVVWFRKNVQLPETMKGKDLVLKVGQIDDSDETWFNGVKVGTTENAYNRRRSYPVSGALVQETNQITVRVRDTGGGGGIWGDPGNLALETSDGQSLSLAGEWRYAIGLETDQQIMRGFGPNDRPSLLFNGMLKPVMPYALKGVIWYQGESNASRAHQYTSLFPAMIRDWRNQWNQGDFPFLFVQLANFRAAKAVPGESDWAELREAQTMTLTTPNTGMAVIIDIGEADDIHPKNKQDVGSRLALAARKVAYNEEIVYSGPMYSSMKTEGDKIRVRFTNSGGGLVAKDRYGYLKGFAIAGNDKKFHWASAQIDGASILVSSPMVKSPVAVRYAWADNPDDANLYNQEGLPALPFRTDTWDGLTKGKK
jgi:sialate O-acetylesterase